MDANCSRTTGEAWLTGIPLELLSKVAAELPIEDLAAMSASDSGLRRRYEEGNLSQGVSLRDIGPALAGGAGEAALLTALKAIGTLALAVQSRWLRRIAERRPGFASHQGDTVVSVWQENFDALKGALRSSPDTLPRALALADLDIADFHAKFPPGSQTCTDCTDGWLWANKFRSGILYSLDKTVARPMVVWPDMLDALFVRNIAFDCYHVDLLMIALGNERLPTVSDRLATAIAIAMMHSSSENEFSHPFTDIADMMQTRLGVTDAQRRDILNPRIAFEICNTHPISSAARWTEGDATFHRLVEEMAIEPLVATIRLPSGSAPVKPTPEQVALFLRMTEPDAVAAYVEIEGASDRDSAAQGVDKLTMFYLKLAEVNSAMAMFEAVKAAPAMAQPMLMDRWASGLDHHSLPEALRRTLVDGVCLWRQSIVRALSRQDRPDGVARAAVAEVRYLGKMFGLHDREHAKHIERLTETAFSSLSIRALGPMLSMLCEAWALDREVISRKSLSRHLCAFLRDPDASWKYASRGFATLLCEEASRIFAALPDSAIGLRSKYDVFCDRMGIAHMDRAPMRGVIEDGIAGTLSAHAFGLKTAVRSHMVGLGFSEEDTVKRIHEKILESARVVT